MAEDSSRAADVLIIGGGIIGCSIAWRLAQAGMKVTVLDRSEPGAEASSAAAGMLAPLGEMVDAPDLSRSCASPAAVFTRASRRKLKSRAATTPLIAATARCWWRSMKTRRKNLRTVHRAQTALGFTLEALPAAEVQARAVGLSQQIRRGLFIPGDHWVDNERLVHALVVACQRAGVRLEAGHAADKFHTKGDRIESVAVGSGSTFTAKTYVLAAGCWSGELAEGLGIQAPITPCGGQMMEFEAPSAWPFVVRCGIHYLVPRPEQRLLVGTTSEYTGFTKAVTAQGLHTILEGVMRLSPLVGQCRFRRAWAGLRPDTADHLPILGYGDMENLVLATGHFRNGILLAPVTAEIIADLIAKGSTSRPIEAYRPTRFKPLGERVIG